MILRSACHTPDVHGDGPAATGEYDRATFRDAGEPAHLLAAYLDSLPEPLLPAHALARGRAVGHQRDCALVQDVVGGLVPLQRHCFVRLMQMLTRVDRSGPADRPSAVRLARALVPHVAGPAAAAGASAPQDDSFVEFVVMAMESALDASQ